VSILAHPAAAVVPAIRPQPGALTAAGHPGKLEPVDGKWFRGASYAYERRRAVLMPRSRMERRLFTCGLTLPISLPESFLF